METQVEKILADSQALTVAGNVQFVPVALLVRRDNVRTAQCLQIPRMVDSIKRHGFKPNHPLVLSEKSDGSLLVLCGNRRSEAIETIAANEPDVFAALFPDGCVPAVVYSGLTEEQEALIRVDHGKDEDRVPLDDWSEFLAIRQLVRAGYDTQSGIAEKMGWFKEDKTGKTVPNRSKVQPRVELAQLPQFVQAEYERYCTQPESGSPVRWSMVAKLAKAYREEFTTFPDGDGPVFQAAWNEAIAPPAQAADKPQPIKPADMEKRAKVVGSRNLRDALLACSGSGKIGLADLDARMIQAECALATLSEIAGYLGKADFDTLVSEAREHAAQAAQAAKTEEPVAAE